MAFPPVKSARAHAQHLAVDGASIAIYRALCMHDFARGRHDWPTCGPSDRICVPLQMLTADLSDQW